MEPSAVDCGLEISDFVVEALRKRYPWMKRNAILDAASTCCTAVTETIKE